MLIVPTARVTVGHLPIETTGLIISGQPKSVFLEQSDQFLQVPDQYRYQPVNMFDSIGGHTRLMLSSHQERSSS